MSFSGSKNLNACLKAFPGHTMPAQVAMGKQRMVQNNCVCCFCQLVALRGEHRPSTGTEAFNLQSAPADIDRYLIFHRNPSKEKM